jgi:hypothetical protein
MTICLQRPSSQFQPGSASPSWTAALSANAGPALQTGHQVREQSDCDTNSLRKFWISALSGASSSARWGNLPEDLLEAYESEQFTIDSSDVKFLMNVAAKNGNGHSDYANTAIRLIGMLLDEGILDGHISVISYLLAILLDHPDPSRRFYAVKALWQGRIVSSTNDLHQRIKTEEHPLVKRVTEQAVEVLERYAKIQ